MKPTQLFYALALQAVPHIGDISAKKLIAHCGSPEAVFKTANTMLSKIKGIGAYALKHLGDSQYLKQAEQEMNFMEKQSIQGLYFEAPDYPNKLKHCIDGPIVLFQKGQVNWTPQPIISIIGTRNITSYGRTQCEK